MNHQPASGFSGAGMKMRGFPTVKMDMEDLSGEAVRKIFLCRNKINC